VSKEEFKKKILKAQEEADIASLFVMEKEAHELLNEEELSGFYANILDLSLERLTEVLEAPRKFDMQDVQDFATLRTLYEYAMEHYSAGKISDASALFEVLSGVTDDELFSQSMKIHMQVTKEGVDLEKFLEEYADLAVMEGSSSFYIHAFLPKAQKLLENLDK